MTRELAKEKKKHDDTAKAMTKKIELLTEDYEGQLKEQEIQFGKEEKILKDELLEYKEKEIRLLNEN